VRAVELPSLRVEEIAQVPERRGVAGVKSEGALERRCCGVHLAALAAEQTLVVVGAGGAGRSRYGWLLLVARAEVAESPELGDLLFIRRLVRLHWSVRLIRLVTRPVAHQGRWGSFHS